MYGDTHVHKSCGSSYDGPIPSRWVWPCMHVSMGAYMCTNHVGLLVTDAQVMWVFMRWIHSIAMGMATEACMYVDTHVHKSCGSLWDGCIP
jgi:hypothetical protein